MSDYFSNNEWKQARIGRFTASEIWKLFQGGRKKDELFGQGAMTYIRTKAAEILTGESKEELDFKAAEWGHAYELEAVLEFEKQTGIVGTYYGGGNPVFFPSGDYAGSSPDWEGINEGADIKCPYNSAIHVENLILTPDEFKKARWEYYCQLQMSMLNRQWEKAYFVSYDPRMIEDKYKLKVLTISPDTEWQDEYQMRLEKAVEKLEGILSSLDTSVLIATHDETLNATIIENA